MFNEKSEKEYVDLMNGKCYGHQVLTKMPNQDKYKGMCKYKCRLKNECINASRENKEMCERNLMQIPYDEGILNKNEGIDDNGELVFTEGMQKEIFFAQGEKAECLDFLDLFLSKKLVSLDMRSMMMEFILRFSCMYFLNPKFLHSVMLKNWYGLSQSDQARLRHVTRQAINDGIMKELAGVSRMDIGVPEQLTELEKAVYVLLSEGKSYREIAEIPGIGSKSKIARVGQSIASKLGKNGTAKFLKRKKIKKNTKAHSRRKINAERRRKTMQET